MTHEELAKKIVDAAMTRPTTAREWWLQERENQLYLAKLFYDRFENKSATMWLCLFAWATPDIWRDPEYVTKEKT